MKSGPYTTLLFDLDHTLLDSDASEASAFEQALAAAGVDQPQQYFADYDRINCALWAAVERGEVTPDQVRFERFEQLIATAGFDADSVTLADAFAGGLGMHGDLYPGVREVLDMLAGQASMALVTNGLTDVQRTRIERLDIGRYFETVVISSEVGASKPSSAIFDVAFERLGWPSRTSALMIGDSLTSDVRGGSEYGISTCWYNPHRHLAGDSDRVDHEIDDLADLLVIVLGAERVPVSRSGAL